MKGLFLGSEASLSTALSPPGAVPWLGGRHRRWKDLQDCCLRVAVSVLGAHVGGEQGWGWPQKATPDGSCLLSPVPTPCPVLSCLPEPERPELPLHPWAGTEYQFVS